MNRDPRPFDPPRFGGRLVLVGALALGVCALTTCTPAPTPDAGPSGKPFEPTWESLQAYEAPEWFRDAKFGIYAHWGPYSAARGTRNTDWYSRNMYREDHPNHEDHLRNHGSVSEFGYKDLIPLFTAEEFDADAWVDLYVEAGARFAGPVAEHADGFAMWDSKLTPWNAARMGPKRDVVGEMAEAVRKRGLKYVTSLHHQWKWGWYPTWDPEVDCSRPEYAALYGPAVPPTAWASEQADGSFDVMRPDPLPDADFQAEWLAKAREVITGYQPDLLWFDNRMQTLTEDVRMQMAAFYYNQAAESGRSVVLTYKPPDLREGTATIDLERSRMADIHPEPWLTDSSIAASSWSYATDLEYYSTARLIHDLVDIVSKNGSLLLNVAPTPEGTIPDEQQERLRGMGAWLSVNGDAIYETRPWKVFGEGPTRTPQGHLADLQFGGFTAEDIRFTRSKDGQTLYAIALGWPESGRLLVRSLADEAGEAESVRLLGHSEPLDWKQTAEGLELVFPETSRDQPAFAFEVTGLAPLP